MICNDIYTFQLTQLYKNMRNIICDKHSEWEVCTLKIRFTINPFELLEMSFIHV